MISKTKTRIVISSCRDTPQSVRSVACTGMESDWVLYSPLDREFRVHKLNGAGYTCLSTVMSGIEQ